MASLKSFLDEYEAGLSAQQPAKQQNFDLSRFNDVAPPAPKTDIGGFTAAAKRAVGAGIQGVGQLGADFIPGVSQDNALRQYGKGVVDANAPAITSLGDIADRPGMALKEASGNVAGSVGTAVGIRALGQGITMEQLVPFGVIGSSRSGRVVGLPHSGRHAAVVWRYPRAADREGPYRS